MGQDAVVVARTAVAFVLAFILGFEREMRGSQAGDRTFSLVGASAAAIAAVTYPEAPAAVAGIVTGIGFIGGGIVLHAEGGAVKGITTAATILASAAMGIVVGTGHLLAGVASMALILLALEIRQIPGLRSLDARRYSARARNDEDGPT